MNFNEKVWDICRSIPEGKVTTYKLLAEKLGTRAYRAEGQAMNKNPYWPQVPCHRVVGTDGSLTGFARGLDEKRKLLNKEGIEIKNNKINLNRYLYRP